MYFSANDIKQDGHFEAACDACLSADRILSGHSACVINDRVLQAVAAGEGTFYSHGSWWTQDHRSRRTVRRRWRRHYRSSRRYDARCAQWMNRPPLRVSLLSAVSR